jgi:CRP-like cAMP-binding protein
MDVLARAEVLAAAPVFAAVPAPALVALASRAVPRVVPAGDQLATRRDDTDVVIVVATGALDYDGFRHERGALLGPVAALTSAPITTRALDHTTVLELAIDDLFDVLAEQPAATAVLARSLAARLREAP